MGKFAGAEYVKHFLKVYSPETEISEFGCRVADLLGDLFCGIYHLDRKSIERAEWDNKERIVVPIGWKDWSTYDWPRLTRLVFLAHHCAIRLEFIPTKIHYVRLVFSRRARVGRGFDRHPTLAEAVDEFNRTVTIPEYKDELHHENE